LTFSRGGILTGAGVVLAFLALLYFHSSEYGKLKSKQSLLYFICCVFTVGMLVSFQTGGLIEKRYSNRDHLGRTKRDKITDRKELAKEELNLFIKNPILGIGVGEGDKEREKEIGQKYASHDEITRMLAEHGSLGLLGLLILFITPIWMFFNNKQNIFLVPFFLFWFLTINHSGMRIAAPAFIYALMLLNVSLDDPFFSKQLTTVEVDSK
jgi:O-antigen ligase